KLMLADIDAFLARLSEEHPQQPLMLIGNCWGAKACAHIARDDYVPERGRKVKLSGLVLIAPAISTLADVDLMTKVKIAFFHFVGGEARFPIPLKPSMFTKNSRYLSFIERDPLRLTEATADFFVATFVLGILAQKAAGNIRLPLLVLQGGKDEIVDPQRIREWFDRTSAEDKTMRVFPETAHSIDFDENSFREYAHLLGEWILARSQVAAQ
ncbi:MAG TPA: alpha/beta hydrolase, partial [Candidatus Obscuribacterales bacterium]